MSTLHRQPAGQPTGGEFASKGRAESAVSLTAGTAPQENAAGPSVRVFAHHLSAVERRVDEANRKLARAGIEERFAFETESIVEHRDGIDVELLEVRLNAPRISYGGWQITGVHEFTPSGDVISHTFGREDAPAVEDAHCDQCGTNRRREKVYTLSHHGEGGRQVGSSCLTPFLGVRPEGLWAIGDDLDLDDFDAGNGSNLNARVFDTSDLVVAALVASADGEEYVSASQGSWTVQPTAARATRQFAALLGSGDTPARRKLANRIIRWVKKQPDDGADSYMANLKASLGGDWVKTKHAGIAVSAVSAFRHAERRERATKQKAKEKAAEQRAFLAPKDAKLAQVPARVRSMHSFETMYGDMTIVQLVTDDGYVLKWKTQNPQDLAEGQAVTIDRATVKAHEIYRDTFETVILRPKFTVG
ncbi:hypothetical protein [Agromyces subbeticus]|uniref:hypothetical protein n=1 Tax=Agromyces subbeticus TaxID=293890 RepID=UPI0003B37832|nr:hypothetical protein [Agromyces subbeticus]